MRAERCIQKRFSNMARIRLAKSEARPHLAVGGLLEARPCRPVVRLTQRHNSNGPAPVPAAARATTAIASRLFDSRASSVAPLARTLCSVLYFRRNQSG